jgi:hypothetical protein
MDPIVSTYANKKRVIMLLIDSLMYPPLEKAVKEGPASAFQFFMENESVHVISGVRQGKLIFKPNGPLVDEYEQSWDLAGDVGVLNLTVKNNKIFYDEYPDALARLYSSLTSHRGNYLVVSAKPGFEFIGEALPLMLEEQAMGDFINKIH